MMKSLFLLVLGALFLAFRPNTPSVKVKPDDKPGIVFIENSWKAALAKAKVSRKYIFVDAYATWCGPCKTLKSVTFVDPEAAAFFNTNFVNVSMDMEKGEGLKKAREWQVEAYPTLIVFDPDGKPLLGSVGLLSAKDLIRFGKEALTKK